MTLLLGVIAAVLLIGIVAASISASKNDDVLGLVTPHAVDQAAAALTSTTGPLIIERNVPRPGTSQNIAPDSNSPTLFENVLAEREAEAAQTFSLASFYPGNLGVGTTLTYRGVPSTIFGVISFEFNGELWQDYLAEHGEGHWWRFGVQPDRGMKLDAFEKRPLAIEPGLQALTVDQIVYTLTESGRAQYRSSGHTNLFETGRYAFFDYESPTGEILSFERFDEGPWITSVGHHVNPQAVQVSNTVPEFDL